MKLATVILLALTTAAQAYTPATDEQKGIWLGSAISLEMRCETLRHMNFGEAIRVMTWLEGAMFPSHFEVVKNALERANATSSYYDTQKGWIEFPNSSLNPTGCENLKNAIRMQLHIMAASKKR